MDLESSYLIIGVVVITAAILLIIDYLFKNKSYEEVVAEQRQQTTALYNSKLKPKVKEKKQKKALKKENKLKEKQVLKAAKVETPAAAGEKEDAAPPNKKSVESNKKVEAPAAKHHANLSNQKLHVEFVEQPVRAPLDKPITTKRKQKKDAVRPILINRDSSSENIRSDLKEVPTANHFEELHPKDEVEMFNSHLKEEIKKKPAQQSKKETAKKEPATNTNSVQAQPAQNQHPAQTQQEKQSKLPPSDVPATKSKKEKTKQNSEKQISVSQTAPAVNAVKQMNGTSAVPPSPPVKVKVTVDAPVVNGGSGPKVNNQDTTIHHAKEKKKKKSVINALIASNEKHQITLNNLLPLVRKAEMSRQEVQMLIEMLLNKQQDAPIVHEWSESKGDPVSKLKKQMAEKEKYITELQETLTSSQNKLKEVRNEQTSERSQLMHNIRELEGSVKHLKLERMAYDNKLQVLTNNLTILQDKFQETQNIMDEYTNLKRQKNHMDMQIAQLQEAEVKISKLRTELQEVQKRHTLENHAAMEQYVMQVKQLQMQISSVKEEYKQKEMEIMEVMEAKSNVEKQCAQLKADIQRRIDEARIIEHKHGQELQAIIVHKEDALKYSNEVVTLQKELERIKDQMAEIATSRYQLTEENKKLTNLNNSLIDEKIMLEDEKRKLIESKMNGSVEIDKRYQMQIKQLENELLNTKMQMQQTQDSYKNNLDVLKKQYDAEMEEQRSKNNELRQKNWKVMEALKAIEMKVSNQIREKTDELLNQVRHDERENYKALVQQFFPHLKFNEKLEWDKWQEDAMQIVQQSNGIEAKAETNSSINNVDENNAKIVKLQSKVTHYKTIIDETEGILSRLQKHIEDEEIHWRRELKAKDDCIQKLREQIETQNSTELSDNLNELDDATSLNNSSNLKDLNNHSTNGPSITSVPSSNSSSTSSSVNELPIKKNKKKQRSKNK